MGIWYVSRNYDGNMVSYINSPIANALSVHKHRVWYLKTVCNLFKNINLVKILLLMYNLMGPKTELC